MYSVLHISVKHKANKSQFLNDPRVDLKQCDLSGDTNDMIKSSKAVLIL